MKKFNLIAVSLIFAAMLAVSAAAQTGDKIGLVDWGQFGDPTKGIKKYSVALTALDKEFEIINNELRTMGTKYQTLQKEIAGIQEACQKDPKCPFDARTVQAKVDELGQIERDIKKKQEDGAAKYKSSYSMKIGPIQNDILKAMNEYAEQKGYSVIFDGAKLEEAGILLGFAKKTNVTDDFITFYNARPATATTTK